MNKLINYLRGTARVEVTGMFPERVVNLCAQNRVEFWAVDWADEGIVRMTVRSEGVEAVGGFAERVDCCLKVIWQRGMPQFFSLFRQRYGFLAGMAAALLTVAILSGFILRIEITGNERVDDAVILQQLQRYGVRLGRYGPALDRRQIEQEILLENRDLAWMTINLNGTLAEVQVLETKPEPKRVDESGFYHIVAKADGIITGIEPEQGDALVVKGDTVVKGDVLISGTVTMEPPKYSDLPNRYYQTHARGRVWARTWRQITAVFPLETQIKQWTGREKRSVAINFFGTRMEFCGNSSISDGLCDKITSVRRAALPGGLELPVFLVSELYREYTLKTVCVERDAAIDLMKVALERHLTDLVGETGRIVGVTYETRVADGLIWITAVGECLEEIGQEQCAESES